MSPAATAANPSSTASGGCTQRHRRPSSSETSRLELCHPLRPASEPIDLSSLSPIQALASLHFLVLSHLADLEARLSQLDLVDLGMLKAKSETTIDEVRRSARTALEMLQNIKAGVRSHFPELHIPDMSVESLISHSPGVDFADVRTHFPDVHLPSLQDWSSITEVRSRFPDLDFADMRGKLHDVRSRIHDIDFHTPLTHIPVLSDRLRSLHSHISSMGLPSNVNVSPSMATASLLDLLDAFLSSELLLELLRSPEATAGAEDTVEKAEKQVVQALSLSFNGTRLIRYDELPSEWKNNPFIRHGYRFVPLERWPLLALSLLEFHNETLNIHTHLIPLMIWTFNLSSMTDITEVLFMGFALLCLLCSTVWHTMSGCAHFKTVDFCARLDYVGIGWLICASIFAVVHHGLRCHAFAGQVFIGFCVAGAVAGTAFPFMQWFNDLQYRKWRIFFFLCLSISGFAPVVYMTALYGPYEVFWFISPLFSTWLTYLVGLVFYAVHVPERFYPQHWGRWCDHAGGVNSHAIWHIFIVLAIHQNRIAIGVMKEWMSGAC